MFFFYLMNYLNRKVWFGCNSNWSECNCIYRLDEEEIKEKKLKPKKNNKRHS